MSRSATDATGPSGDAEGDALWRGGWYRYAHPVASPNFGARPPRATIDLIVLHSISLPPGEFGGDAVGQLFTNTLDWSAHPYFKTIEGAQVSAHFFVRRDGRAMQFVSCDDRAWHAGTSTYRGRPNCNDDSVGIELEGIEGDTFTPEQYETLAALCAAVGQRYPVRHVAGHEHVAPGRKNDPGAGFSWRTLHNALGWPTQCFPEGVLAAPTP